MFRRACVFLSVALLLLSLVPARFLSAEANHIKTIWNYDGGLLMTTDGSIPSGPCFRINGRVTAPDYFDDLKRVDTDSGSVIRRGREVVTEFPEKVHLSFLMYDLPCDVELKQTGTRAYLTRALVSTMRLSFYWKRGLQMRPATGVVPSHYEIRRIQPYASEFADKLPEKLEWLFEFDVPSAGVPVTDSLVIVLSTPNGYIAARAAARM
jgi:hypothetical protein